LLKVKKLGFKPILLLVYSFVNQLLFAVIYHLQLNKNDQKYFFLDDQNKTALSKNSAADHLKQYKIRS
jgi:hypothetical protein